MDPEAGKKGLEVGEAKERGSEEEASRAGCLDSFLVFFFLRYSFALTESSLLRN